MFDLKEENDEGEGSKGILLDTLFGQEEERDILKLI